MTELFLFTDVMIATSGTLGRPFDAMVPGTFWDMYGRKTHLEADDFDEYIENTKRAILATKDENDVIVGLPIDAKGHEEGDGAGWIIDINLETIDDHPVIRVTPNWTKIGLDLLENNIRRFFSPTIDLTRKVIMGGTLTNWPATRDIKTGEIALRPIVMSLSQEGLYRLAEGEAMDEKLDRIRRAWWEAEDTREGPTSWIVEGGIFEDHVIVDREDGFWKVPYLYEGDEVNFAGPDEWAKVKRTWTELIREFFRGFFQHAEEVDYREGLHEENRDENNQEVEEMKFNLSDLSSEDRAGLIDEVIVKLGLEPGTIPESDNSEIGKTLTQLIDARATEMVKEQTEQAQKENEVSQLCSNLVEGSDELPQGLPVKEDVLKKFMLSLDPEQRKSATEIFELIHSQGLVDFTERGHRRKVKGGTPLSEKMGNELKSYLELIPDATVGGFFELNAESLGPIEDYNLTEFEKEGD